MTTVKCPACNGQGFVAKWELNGTAPRLHKADCARCGMMGFIFVDEKEGEEDG